MSNNLKDDVKNAVPANKSNDKSTLPQFKPAKTVVYQKLGLKFMYEGKRNAKNNAKNNNNSSTGKK